MAASNFDELAAQREQLQADAAAASAAGDYNSALEIARQLEELNIAEFTLSQQAPPPEPPIYRLDGGPEFPKYG
ncbi:MAG TPA: hypothetical protein V6D06_11600 [Trichocoleus sp.]